MIGFMQNMQEPKTCTSTSDYNDTEIHLSFANHNKC